MTGKQWRTLALFAGIVLAVGFVDSRVAWAMLGAVGVIMAGRWLAARKLIGG